MFFHLKRNKVRKNFNFLKFFLQPIIKLPVLPGSGKNRIRIWQKVPDPTGSRSTTLAQNTLFGAGRSRCTTPKDLPPPLYSVHPAIHETMFTTTPENAFTPQHWLLTIYSAQDGKPGSLPLDVGHVLRILLHQDGIFGFLRKAGDNDVPEVVSQGKEKIQSGGRHRRGSPVSWNHVTWSRTVIWSLHVGRSCHNS